MPVNIIYIYIYICAHIYHCRRSHSYGTGRGGYARALLRVAMNFSRSFYFLFFDVLLKTSKSMAC